MLGSAIINSFQGIPAWKYSIEISHKRFAGSSRFLGGVYLNALQPSFAFIMLSNFKKGRKRQNVWMALFVFFFLCFAVGREGKRRCTLPKLAYLTISWMRSSAKCEMPAFLARLEVTSGRPYSQWRKREIVAGALLWTASFLGHSCESCRARDLHAEISCSTRDLYSASPRY